MEPITRKTANEIIDETVAFYGEDLRRRSVEVYRSGATACKYNGPNNKQCAFARCATPFGLEVLSEKEGTACTKLYDKQDTLIEVDTLLKEEYKGQNPTFWKVLQQLHDTNEYWELSEGKGLSAYGLVFVETFKNTMTLNNNALALVI